SAERAIAFLRKTFRESKSGLYALDLDGKAKLGASGLALIAMCREIDARGRSADRQVARRLARFIVSQQRKDGGFESYLRLRGDEPAGSTSLYYPGEAMLGLLRLHEITKERWLIGSVRRGADYLIRTEREGGPLPPAPWFIQAVELFYRSDPSPGYSKHAIDLAEAMVANRSDDVEGGDLEGGADAGDARLTPVASRAEGLIAAYRLARRTADPRSGVIADALKAATRFQI